MKRTLGVICGVLFAVVVGLSLRGGPQRKTETLVQTSTQPASEQSEPVAPTQVLASAGPVTVQFRIQPTFSDEQPAVPTSTNNSIVQ